MKNKRCNRFKPIYRTGGNTEFPNATNKNELGSNINAENNFVNNPPGRPLEHYQTKNTLFQNGGNTAQSEDDYSEGLNKGINVFEFEQKGLKKMTMNPSSGPIEYPIDYEGYTNGELTDQGTANPGEDFSVNGDTVIETPDLTDMSFNKAYSYASNKKLPVFKWKNNEYPIKRNMKYNN